MNYFALIGDIIGSKKSIIATKFKNHWNLA